MKKKIFNLAFYNENIHTLVHAQALPHYNKLSRTTSISLSNGAALMLGTHVHGQPGFHRCCLKDEIFFFICVIYFIIFKSKRLNIFTCMSSQFIETRSPPILSGFFSHRGAFRAMEGG